MTDSEEYEKGVTVEVISFQCCNSEIAYPKPGQVNTCPECSSQFALEGTDFRSVEAHESAADEPEFPEGFTGAGPMFAAVPVGEPWYDLAAAGASTYIIEKPGAYLPDSTWPAGDPNADESAAQWRAYAGDSAFLDRDQAESIADQRGLSGVTRWDGLTEHHPLTKAAAARVREAEL